MADHSHPTGHPHDPIPKSLHQGPPVRLPLSLLPYCGAFLIAGTLPLFVKLPFQWGASALRMALWVLGLLGWFLGGIVSYAHALN